MSARLDVAAVGLYAPFERTFFYIRVTHPNCDTNTFKPLDKIYKDHEKEKKDLYEESTSVKERIFCPGGGGGGGGANGIKWRKWRITHGFFHFLHRKSLHFIPFYPILCH